jgi:hypothetical protein
MAIKKKQQAWQQQELSQLPWHVNYDKFDVHLPYLIFDSPLSRIQNKLFPLFLSMIYKDYKKPSFQIM